MTRAAGLDHLAAVTADLGRAYAIGRNADPGPEGERATSALSPWLRRRLVLEREVAGAALDSHGPAAAEKFVQEVFWRTYFKGYLETRPTLWTSYLAALAEPRSSGLRRAVDDATAGRTGIECFDDWARELVETGWLHNHTRMWFASIWIFTLQLPWALGADFFLRHLVDGDPASNTLSWRWVAGLHTRGKAYAARAENIHRYTDGRYTPTGLNEHPVALREDGEAALQPLPIADAAPFGEVALLLHVDDLHPESLPVAPGRVRRVAGMLAHAPNAVDRVRAADGAALADALDRAAAQFDCPAVAYGPDWHDGLPVIAAWAPVGPSATALPACHRFRRSWDTAAWPHATRGYFQVKAVIPKVLRAENVTH